MRMIGMAASALAVIGQAAVLAGCGGGGVEAGAAAQVPARAGDVFGKRTLDLSSGITVGYVDVGNAEGEAVILLHGYTDTGRSFFPTMEHLAELRPDLRLIAPDLRGHGESSLPPGDCAARPSACFGMVDFAADVIALMDTLHIARASFVGHSLGSFVAQEVALTHPGRVERLVLIGTTATVSGNPVVTSFLRDDLVYGRWKQALEVKGLEWPAGAYSLTAPDAQDDAAEWLAANWVVETAADADHLADIAPETTRIPMGTWIGALDGLLAVDNADRLADLRAPTLVLWATQDVFFPESDQVRLRGVLDRAAASCRMHYFWKQYGRAPLPASGVQDRELGHNTHWGAPRAVAEDIAAFLQDNGAPTATAPYADRSSPGGIRLAIAGGATIHANAPCGGAVRGSE